MDRQQSLNLLADALDDLLIHDDQTAVKELRAKPLRIQLHEDAADVLWSNVGHFIDDADVRAREPEYREMQENCLRKLVEALRRGASREELLRFSFLRPV